MPKENTSTEKTKMNISLTAEDKRFLKVYAAERDLPVSMIIHEWIERARQNQNITKDRRD